MPIPKPQLVTTLPETNSQSTWKWMVGIRSFPFGARPIFRGQLLVSGSVVDRFDSNWKYPQIKLRILSSKDTRGEKKPKIFDRKYPPYPLQQTNIAMKCAYFFNGYISSGRVHFPASYVRWSRSVANDSRWTLPRMFKPDRFTDEHCSLKSHVHLMRKMYTSCSNQRTAVKLTPALWKRRSGCYIYFSNNP